MSGGQHPGDMPEQTRTGCIRAVFSLSGQTWRTASIVSIIGAIILFYSIPAASIQPGHVNAKGPRSSHSLKSGPTQEAQIQSELRILSDIADELPDESCESVRIYFDNAETALSESKTFLSEFYLFRYREGLILCLVEQKNEESVLLARLIDAIGDLPEGYEGGLKILGQAKKTFKNRKGGPDSGLRGDIAGKLEILPFLTAGSGISEDEQNSLLLLKARFRLEKILWRYRDKISWEEFYGGWVYLVEAAEEIENQKWKNAGFYLENCRKMLEINGIKTLLPSLEQSIGFVQDGRLTSGKEDTSKAAPETGKQRLPSKTEKSLLEDMNRVGAILDKQAEKYESLMSLDGEESRVLFPSLLGYLDAAKKEFKAGDLQDGTANIKEAMNISNRMAELLYETPGPVGILFNELSKARDRLVGTSGKNHPPGIGKEKDFQKSLGEKIQLAEKFLFYGLTTSGKEMLFKSQRMIEADGSLKNSKGKKDTDEALERLNKLIDRAEAISPGSTHKPRLKKHKKRATLLIKSGARKRALEELSDGTRLALRIIESGRTDDIEFKERLRLLNSLLSTLPDDKGTDAGKLRTKAEMHRDEAVTLKEKGKLTEASSKLEVAMDIAFEAILALPHSTP